MVTLPLGVFYAPRGVHDRNHGLVLDFVLATIFMLSWSEKTFVSLKSFETKVL